MADYHLGEEINKEMRRRGMKPADFAAALNKERQTVYDIFKKRHIATDTLTTICRVLGRDFFAELSEATLGPADAPEDEAELREAVSALMPSDRLHAFRANAMLQELIEEYLISPRKRPLVLLCPPGRLCEGTDSLPALTEKLILMRQGRPHADYCPDFRRISSKLYVSDTIEGLKSLIYTGDDYSEAIEIAREKTRTSLGHVILYLSVLPELKHGEHGGLVLDDVAATLFDLWQGRAHMALVQGRHHMLREYYRAYRGAGILDGLVKALNEGVDAAERIFDLVFGSGVLEAREERAPDGTGLSRIRLYYRGTDRMDSDMATMMFKNGVNNHPLLELWLDVRNGYIIDFQYNKRTQP